MPNRYRSQHPFSTPPTASTFGASIATALPVTNVGGLYETPAKLHDFVKPFAEFGPKESQKPDAAQFIAAHAHDRPKQVKPPATRVHNKRKPELNTKPFIVNEASKPVRNFVAANTTTVANMKTATSKIEQVNFLAKADYGQVPAYLHEVKEQLVSEKEAVTRALAAKNGTNSNVYVLKDEDRQELLVKLKVRWEETMKAFQLLAHMNANSLSIGNLKRKEELESQLQELEKAIAKIDHEVVLVRYNDA